MRPILGLVLLLSGDSLVTNGDFETRQNGAEVPGWTLTLGAQNGAQTPESRVEIDRTEGHDGGSSLHFCGDRSTRGWIIAKQEIPVRPGGRYELEAWTKTVGVEPNGFGLDNCYVGLVFLDGDGQSLGRDFAFPQRPDSKWSKQHARLTAAPNARKGYIYLFLSMIGDLWVDDVALEISGGQPLPEPELVFKEDFASAKRLSSKWKREVGATNGTGGKESAVEIDEEVASDGARSLRLSGDADTCRWFSVERSEKAEPGELYRFETKVRAEGVQREGMQFDNLHARIAFLDRKGEILGSARFASAGEGTFDWTPLATEGIAPEGTKKVLAGVFLSKSGTAWFDELTLWRTKGYPPPYSGWETVEVEGIVLRYSPEHPEAAQMKTYARRLRESKQATCRALEVEFEEDITVFLYGSNEEGRSLTGRDLDFADPGGRRVHQKWNSYIGHEMVHVVAHTRLQNAQTGILGEGIAVWLNGQAPERHHRRAQELRAAGELPSVAELISAFREQSNGYPAAGSFCGFLLETHGLELFKELYPLENPSARFEERTGKSFEALEPQWHALLEKYR